MNVRTCENEDFYRINVQAAQVELMDYLHAIDIRPLVKINHAWSIEHDGEILAITGLIPKWENRAEAWTVLSKDSGKHFVKIVRIIKELLNVHDYRRIQATTEVDFKQAHRWLKLLGFVPEGYMKAYSVKGEDHILYARVKQ